MPYQWVITWTIHILNPKVLTMIFFFKQVIFRFHVNFPGCFSIRMTIWHLDIALFTGPKKPTTPSSKQLAAASCKPSRDGKDCLPTNVFLVGGFKPNWKTLVLVKLDHETPIFGIKIKIFENTTQFYVRAVSFRRICIIWCIGSHWKITCSPTQQKNNLIFSTISRPQFEIYL